jgi:hypothetical protein
MRAIGGQYTDSPCLGAGNSHHDFEESHQHLLGIRIRAHAAGDFCENLDHGQTIASILIDWRGHGSPTNGGNGDVMIFHFCSAGKKCESGWYWRRSSSAKQALDQ